jgi:hypothetical protein
MATGATVDLAGGVGSFDASLTYDPSGLEIVDVRDAPGFAGSTVFDFTTTPGVLQVQGTPEAGGGPVGPTSVVLAKIVIRLIGSATTSTELTLDSLVLTEADTGASMSQEVAPANVYLRGDTNGSGSVTIFDALFIQQCLAQLREYGTAAGHCHPVNSGAVRHESLGDKVSVFDALFIQQYLAALRDEFYVTK